ncbi:hypothetical protein EVAR_34507_1 [Eumeta japonica]|uniref:Uncharacterized protein n=1 Tax=Eumeta variegata TaxID=151549 RepID=A0A4C1Z6T2_EUMVA|nr:hypothetical protein EVAR_34507_1 [Eumeta japonica]
MPNLQRDKQRPRTSTRYDLLSSIRHLLILARVIEGDRTTPRSINCAEGAAGCQPPRRLAACKCDATAITFSKVCYVQYNGRNFAALNCLRLKYCAGITLRDPSLFSTAFLFYVIATLS